MGSAAIAFAILSLAFAVRDAGVRIASAIERVQAQEGQQQ
jgi:hypothetical protein